MNSYDMQHQVDMLNAALGETDYPETAHFEFVIRDQARRLRLLEGSGKPVDPNDIKRVAEALFLALYNLPDNSAVKHLKVDDVGALAVAAIDALLKRD